MFKTAVLLCAGVVASSMLAQPGESSPAPPENIWLAAKPTESTPACPCGSVCQCDELKAEVAALKVQLASLSVRKPAPVQEVATGSCANGACAVRSSGGGCAGGACGAGPVRRLFQARPRIFGRWR